MTPLRAEFTLVGEVQPFNGPTSKPEMLERVQQFDWASTSLGPMDDWPRNLRTAVDICLNSRFPMVIWWGDDLTLIYNDAWRPIIGTKHPSALGRPGQSVFPEIWDIIGPMHCGVLGTGQATWSDDQLLAMHRSKYIDIEEAYFTWSYSPILNEDGRVGGVFTAVNETTGRVLSERRLETLRTLSARAAESRTVTEACGGAGKALADNDADIAFGLLYLLEPGRRAARLIECIRLQRGTQLAPELLELDAAEPCPWPIGDVVASGSAARAADLAARFGHLPGGRWPASADEALVLPLTFAGQDRPGGVVVIGLSPYLYLGDAYRSFLDLAVGHTATGISNALAYESERRRAEALAELDRAKTTFFSNVSHEFRTPLTLMLGPLEDLLQLRDPIVEAPREQLDIIHRNGLRLLKLVNNLLDFSRIEAGRIQPCYQEVDLAAKTTEVASVFRSAIDKAGLHFVVDCPPLPVTAFVDREMWEQVVLNLLSNAFKFTLAGSITVRLRAAESHVEFIVQDTGEGIPETELDHIFERFHRVAGTRARSHEGTGIGLALVYELVKLHGGAIRVASTEGEGTTFTVSIPIGSSHLPAHQVGSKAHLSSTALRSDIYIDEAERWMPESVGLDPELNAASANKNGKPRVLIADDNADMRDYLRSLLATQYEIAAVSNGAEALSVLERGPLPDLIVTDVMMPVIDGFELVRRLRENQRTGTLPIVMLSARAGEEASVEGLRAGADDYLVKPFTARELAARVSSQIALARTRRAAELTVRAAEEHLRLALEASNLGTWDLDPKSGDLKWDARHKELFGFPADAEVTLATVLERIHPEDQGAIQKVVALLLDADREREYHWNYRVLWPDGTTKWIAANGKVVVTQTQEGDGSPIRIVGTVRDVTEEKRAEESLRETQKLESLGLLAGGIAHDFNNLLTGVIGNASLLSEEFSAHSKQAEIVLGLTEAAERMSRLTSQMLAYSGRGRFIIESVDLAKQVVQITSLIQASIPKNVQLRLSLANDLRLIDADVSQLQQVIMNLVINAAEAVGTGGGTVEIGTSVQFVGEAEFRANVTRHEVPAGEYVVLTVADSGCGMDQTTCARIFDPFFTTKFTGRGLGLSSVLGVVRGHKGILTVESQLEVGTTFRVFFPISARRVQPQLVPADQSPGEGTILVVDDEEIVRKMAKAALERLGYSVFTAANGKEALHIYSSTPQPIDIVLLDMTMPVMDGEETLNRLIQILPNVVVVAMSGYDEREAKSRFGNRIAGFVNKPFTAGQLSAKIRAAGASEGG